MALTSLNPELHDVFETIFPTSGGARKLIRDINFRVLKTCMDITRGVCKGSVITTERIVEYPQLFRWIRPQGLVLDIGCSTSRLPIELASLGYTVYGLDIRPYPHRHENFLFVQSDLYEWNSPVLFDIITAVSSIEHFGLGYYGDKAISDGDYRAIEKLKSLIKPHGQLILSVPFGARSVTESHRVYDLNQLQKLFADFTWIDSRFFRHHNHCWVPCDAEDLKNVPSDTIPVSGVVLLNLAYPKQD